MSTLPGNENPVVSHQFIKSSLLKDSVCLLDIGARRGLDERWQKISNIVCGFGFELDVAECKRLNKLNSGEFTYIPAALSSHDGSGILFIRRNSDSSGLIPFPDFYSRFAIGDDVDVIKTEKIEVNSFDHIWEKLNKKNIDFLKLDAEGAECEILTGASNFLANNSLLGAEIETRFFSFGDQGRFCDVHQNMSNHGLHLFDIGLVRHSRRAFPDLDEIRGKKDYRKWQSGAQVIASDVLYLRDFVNEKNNGRIFSTDDLQSLLKMIVIFESYDLYDCIIEILNEFKEILSSVLDAYTLVNTITYHKKRYRKYEKYINKANKLKK